MEETPQRILVVDDNPLVSGIIKTLLRQEQFKVYVSENGTEALQLLADNPVDLILCDVMMPKMDGYELFDEVRRRPELGNIPFVFLTALDEKSERAKGSELGVDDYLVKPFEPEELLAVVRGKLKRAGLSKDQYNVYRKKVLHTLSHEFRTPLVAINTGAELLIDQSKKDEDSKEAKKTVQLLEAIRRSGARLEKLVADFIQLQQIDAGIAERIYQERRIAKPISTIINTISQRWQPILKEQNIAFGIAGERGDVTIVVHEAQIVDLVGRLIDNAIKFSDENKEVVLEFKAEPKWGVISVLDRGVGLDPGVIQQNLDMFEQHGREKREQQGGGLGLAIATKLAAINQGHLEFERRPDKGSCVRVYLPRGV